MKLCLGAFLKLFILCRGRNGKKQFNNPELFAALVDPISENIPTESDRITGILRCKDDIAGLYKDYIRLRSVDPIFVNSLKARLWENIFPKLRKDRFDLFMLGLKDLIRRDQTINEHTLLNIVANDETTFGQLDVFDYTQNDDLQEEITKQGNYVTSIYLYIILNTNNREGNAKEISEMDITYLESLRISQVDRTLNTTVVTQSTNVLVELCEKARGTLAADHYIEREELYEIYERIKLRQSPVFLYGIGGIGKTTIACQFAARYCREFDVYFSVYSGSLKNTIASLKIRTDLHKESNEKDKTLDDKYRENVALLRKLDRKAVLIIDNADTGDGCDIRAEKEYQDDLCQMDMQFIITTRNSMKGVYEALHIQELSEDDCLRLIEKYYPYNASEVSALRRIIQTVNRHTITIELIAKTLDESGGVVSPSSVLRRLENDSIDTELWNEVTTVYGFDYTPRKTLEHLKRVFTLAMLTSDEHRLLINLAIANTSIESSDLYKYWNQREIKSIQGLVRKGWISRVGRFFSLHPVVRHVVIASNWTENYWNNNKNFIFAVLKQARFNSMRPQDIISNVCLNTIQRIGKHEIPGECIGILCVFYLFNGIWSQTEDTLVIKQNIFNIGLSSFEENSMGRYLLYTAYVECMSHIDNTSHDAEIKYAKKRAFTHWVRKRNDIRWQPRERFTLSSEMKSIVQCWIEQLNNTMNEICSCSDTYTKYEMMDNLCFGFSNMSLLCWLLGDTNAELNYATRWFETNAQKAEITERTPSVIMTDVFACAQFHNGLYEQAIEIIKATIQYAQELPQIIATSVLALLPHTAAPL